MDEREPEGAEEWKRAYYKMLRQRNDLQRKVNGLEKALVSTFDMIDYLREKTGDNKTQSTGGTDAEHAG